MIYISIGMVCATTIICVAITQDAKNKRELIKADLESLKDRNKHLNKTETKNYI